MSIPLNVNGVVFDYPETDDQDWGPDATDWASAVTTGMLQKAGGLFQLLAEVDFGTSYGVKSLYYKSRTSNPADAGQVRLARADVINWRNQANSGNLSLGVSASDNLQFNGVDIQPIISVSDTSTIDLTLSSNVLSADIVAGSITNAMINAAAAIAYSKLNLSGSIVNADINASAAIAQSKLSLAITNAELSGSAGITNANLATMADLRIKGNVSGGSAVPSDLTGAQVTAILSNFVGDSGSGGTKGLVPAPATGDATKFLRGDGVFATPPGAGDVVGPASSTAGQIARFADTSGKLLTATPATISNSDVNASAAIAYSKLNLSASIVNADIASAAAIAVNKLAALTASRAVVSDGSGFISAATTTATEIGYVNGVTSAIQTQIDGKLPTTITTTGDMIYSSSGTTAARLAIGTGAQQVIKPVAGVPAWSWPYSVQRSASSTDAISATTDQMLFYDASGGAFTATLPTAASVAGKTYSIVKTDSSLNAITIATTSAQTINGASTTTVSTQYEMLVVCSNGSNWIILQRNIPENRASYTPTLVGFGSPSSVTFVSWRQGKNLNVNFTFTSGISTATAAQLPVGFGGTSANVTVDNTFLSSSGSVVGEFGQSASGAFSGYVVNASSNQTYVNLGLASTSTVGFGRLNGSTIASSGQSISGNFSVPIVGWNA